MIISDEQLTAIKKVGPKNPNFDAKTFSVHYFENVLTKTPFYVVIIIYKKSNGVEDIKVSNDLTSIQHVITYLKVN